MEERSPLSQRFSSSQNKLRLRVIFLDESERTFEVEVSSLIYPFIHSVCHKLFMSNLYITYSVFTEIVLYTNNY